MDLVLVEQLCEELKKTPYYIKLKQSEQEMMKDTSLHPQFMKYQTAQSVYNDALRLNLDASRDKEKLLDIKHELEKNPTVAAYLNNYKSFGDYLEKIVHTIYKDVVDDTLINNPFRKWVL